jgi:hypothetical protein
MRSPTDLRVKPRPRQAGPPLDAGRRSPEDGWRETAAVASALSLMREYGSPTADWLAFLADVLATEFIREHTPGGDTA